MNCKAIEYLESLTIQNIKAYNVDMGRKLRTEPNERDLYINSQVLIGRTFSSIAKELKISCERVSQIMERYFSITGFDLSHERQTKREEQRLNNKNQGIERRVQRKFGCSYDEFYKINGVSSIASIGTISLAYSMQKRNAKKRGIEWKFTFPEWWEVWQDSGKWDLRGKGKGYCMSRHGDIGPYSKENVTIKTIGENFSESYIKTPFKIRYEKRMQRKKLDAAQADH